MNLFGEKKPAPAPITTYRAQISGWAAGDQGQVPVWMKNSADGTYAVPFHGHTLRPTDQGETEVFLDAWGTETESAFEDVPDDADDLMQVGALRASDVAALAGRQRPPRPRWTQTLAACGRAAGRGAGSGRRRGAVRRGTSRHGHHRPGAGGPGRAEPHQGLTLSAVNSTSRR